MWHVARGQPESQWVSREFKENLLRNGSFEGGLLYWHQIDPKRHTLVRDAAAGEFALRIAKGNIRNAPFVAEQGKLMPVSFSVKGEKAGNAFYWHDADSRQAA